MSNTLKRPAVALLLGLSGLTLFLSAACGAVATPVPLDGPGTEVAVVRPVETSVPASTLGPASTPVPASTHLPVSAATAVAAPVSEDAGKIPAAFDGLAGPSGSIRSGGGADGDDLALYIPPKRELKYPNLGSGLDGLVASVEAEEMTAEEAAANTPVHSGESVAVTVHLSGNVDELDELVAFLEENGGDPRNVGEDYVEAYVPLMLLGPLSERPGVLRVREIVPPERARGG